MTDEHLRYLRYQWLVRREGIIYWWKRKVLRRKHVDSFQFAPFGYDKDKDMHSERLTGQGFFWVEGTQLPAKTIEELLDIESGVFKSKESGK